MSFPPHLELAPRLSDEPVLRAARAPELGPRILFFSGGSALGPLSRVLKQFTHNSVHLITAFDSGGSSAQLRRAFAMPAIGDLRNRIVALADESAHGNPQVYSLFAYRLPSGGAPRALRDELEALGSGQHSLVQGVTPSMRGVVQTHLRSFVERMPAEFDLRGASIGNLLLVGGFLSHSRDLGAVLSLFSELIGVRGVVRPIVDADLHLGAELEDGRRLVGQHRVTGKEVEPLPSPVRDLYLVDALDRPALASASISDAVRHSIEAADLICFPMGSFYTSLIANLLPRGVGRAIASASCPRVYVPNTRHDPEQQGMSVAGSVEALLRYARRDAGQDLPLSRVVNVVILDRDPDNYAMRVEVDRIERMGVQVLLLDLVTESSHPHVHPGRLTEALLSLT